MIYTIILIFKKLSSKLKYNTYFDFKSKRYHLSIIIIDK